MNVHTFTPRRRESYSPDFTAWPSWPLRLDAFLEGPQPWLRACLQSIADEAGPEGEPWLQRDDIHYAAQAAADGCKASLQELIDIFDADDEPDDEPLPVRLCLPSNVVRMMPGRVGQ